MSDEPLAPLNSLHAFEAAGRRESFLYAAAGLRAFPGAPSAGNRYARKATRIVRESGAPCMNSGHWIRLGEFDPDRMHCGPAEVRRSGGSGSRKTRHARIRW